MQSFILAAGHGTRLAPLSHILPKPLVPIHQKPLIHHIMDEHYKAGVRRFIVNISKLDYLWERDFPEGSYRGCPVHFSYEENLLDSGGGIQKILPLINLDEPLIIQNGDIITDIPIGDILALHQKSNKSITLALRSIDGNKNVGFDPASGLITDIRHALNIDAGSYQFAGIYIIDPRIAQHFPPLQDEQPQKFSIVPLWIELIRRHEMAGAIYDWCNWSEIGTPEAYLQHQLDTPCRDRIHPSAKIDPSAKICEDSVIGKDAHIAADVQLIDCIVWPRSHVEAGEYRRCVLTPRIRVEL